MTLNEFQDQTSLILDVLIDRAVAPYSIIDDWFRNHVYSRVIYMYENNLRWWKWLSGRNSRIDPRDQLIVWINTGGTVIFMI